MLHSTLLVMAGLTASVALLAGLLGFVYREGRRILVLDRRLAVPRRRAQALGTPTAAPRAGRRRARRRGPGPRPGAGQGRIDPGAGRRGGAREARADDPPGRLRARRRALPVPVREARRRPRLRQPPPPLWATGSALLGEHVFLVAFSGLAGLVIGSIVPEYVLRALIARRTRNMSAALPDALDLIVMCLESGLTFERALVTVAEELRPIEASLAGELRMMEAELRLGSDRRMVLQEFHRRTEIDGLRDLAMTLIQSERYGTPLTQSMKNIAANERTQRALRIAARAERLPVLLTLPMLLLVVPGTMALVAGPAFLTAIQALGSLGGG